MREAEELQRKVMKRREDHLGASHPETYVSVWNLAKLLEANGSFAEAETFQSGCVVAWGILGRFCLDQGLLMYEVE